MFLGILGAIFGGGWLWRTVRPPVAGPLRLTKVAFDALPGWAASDPRAALGAFARSCIAILGKEPSTPMGGAGYAGAVADWRPACAAVRPGSAAAARDFFQHWFVPVEIGAGGVEDGRFTGYYEPELRASRSRHGLFQVPVYDAPADLIIVDLGNFRKALKGETVAGRLEGRSLMPYPTRAQIDAQGLPNAHVLFYADDPVAVFFLHIQGSGRVRFDDGSMARVAYAAQNGQPYTAIGRTLIAQGVLTRETVSLPSIRAWLKAHPGAARRVMESDASYVFFKLEPVGDPSLGAKGAQGVPLTPMASVAVDKRLHALGAPYYIATAFPDSKPMRGLFIAQDIGGAIRGPVRGDIFFGYGANAETLAGTMNRMGRWFVLLPKPVAARLPPVAEYPGTAP